MPFKGWSFTDSVHESSNTIKRSNSVRHNFESHWIWLLENITHHVTFDGEFAVVNKGLNCHPPHRKWTWRSFFVIVSLVEVTGQTKIRNLYDTIPINPRGELHIKTHFISTQSDFEHVPTPRYVETEYVPCNSKPEHLEHMQSEKKTLPNGYPWNSVYCC